MASEPIVVQVLEGEDAIMLNRKVMGATNPVEADEGTIRKEFAFLLVKILFMVLMEKQLLLLKLVISFLV